MNYIKTYELFDFLKKKKKEYPSMEEKDTVFNNCVDIFYEVEDLGYQVEVTRVYDMGFRTEISNDLKDKMVNGTPKWNAIEVKITKPVDRPVLKEQEFWDDVFPYKTRFIKYLESQGFNKVFQTRVVVTQTSTDGPYVRVGFGPEVPLNAKYALVSKIRWINNDWVPTTFFN